MRHDPSGFDDKLSALYRAHASAAGSQGEQPSAASDAFVLRMAREAVRSSAAVGAKSSPEVSGWRAWMSAPWFGPGLALATIASLAVVVVSLMPKEDMSIEREVAASAAGSAAKKIDVASDVARGVAPVGGQATKPGAAAIQTAPIAPPVPAPAAAESSPAAAAPRAAAPTAAAPTAATPMTAAPTRPAPRQSAPAVASVPSPRTAPADSRRANQAVESSAKAKIAGEGEPVRENSARGRVERNPVAAGAVSSSSPDSLAPAPQSPPPGPPASSETARYEKPSLQSEPAESRLQNQSVAEVPDSAPTYPNEARPSIPLPYTYTMPRKSRDAAAAAGAGASGAAAPSRPQATPSLAAAAPSSDPAEWVKAIQKLRTEGKMEQVLKELAEFRKIHPQYALPEELRNLK